MSLLYIFRQTFVNILDMLKPGGQFFFTVFEKTPLDEVYEKLDEGIWSKYHNREANSPFFKYEIPSKEYENLMKSTGFENCHVYSEHFAPLLPEKAFEGNVCILDSMEVRVTDV